MTQKRIQTIVEEYFTQKERIPSWEIRVFNEDYCKEDTYLLRFTDEELAGFHKLRNKYGEDFVNHLNEVITDEDEFHDVTFLQPVTFFDIDTPLYEYDFTICEVNGDKIQRRNARVTLSDEQYKKLLGYILEDKHMNYNMLKHCDKSIFSAIEREIEWHFCDEDGFVCFHPFTVEMKEAQEDVDKIVVEHPELRPGNDGSFRIYTL